MNILFGNKEVDAIRNEKKFTILELDTIQATPEVESHTAYCVLSDVPLTEIGLLAQKVRMHHDMMHFYRTAQWVECRELIVLLRGSWNGEVDSFYDEISRRLDYLESAADISDWDGVYRPWRR
jgi:hypothetical protein